ncbi:MAG: Phosphoserine phosphatase [Actinomycetota bacterium]|jgi:phosphoserine phosphatase
MTYRLVLLDLDSTLIQDEVIDLLAQEAGRGNEVKEITDRAMAGEMDFVEALKKRVSYLSGLKVSIFEKLAREIQYSDGAMELIEFCKSKRIPIGAVSGGFKQAVDALGLPQKLDFVRANELEEENGIITGRLVGRIIDAAAKAEALLDFAALTGVPLSETIAIGDGANDIEMIRTAGLGIAFKAKPALRDAADKEISHSLTELIPLLRNF